MNKFLPLALGLLLAIPAVAQSGRGSINTNAPTITQSVTNGDAKISLDYTSIALGKGTAFNMAMDKEKGARTRTQINNQAKASPMGSFSTSVAVTIGELKVPAGEYKMAFTISDECEWQVNFMGKETLTMKLPLTDNKEMQHKRLLCSLFAGDDAGAGIYIAFGEKSCVLTVAPAKDADKKG